MFLSDDDMVECPYNKTHRMLRRRLQSHLLKCRLSYPDVELRKCPFNITHLIPEPEFTHHATNCPDRKLITQYKYDAPEPKEEEAPKHAPIDCDEDWDDTAVQDYNPSKYLEKANIIRRPEGANPSERKMFIKKERKRLGDGDDSSGEETNAKTNLDKWNEKHSDGGPRAPSPKAYYWETKAGSSGRKRSTSPPSTSSYSKKRSRSPPNTFRQERSRSRSRSPLGFRKTQIQHSSPTQRSPSYSGGNSYNSDQDYYYNGSSSRNAYSGRDPYYSNDSHANSYYDRNTETTNNTMPPVPPPPMISYPAPRSYNTSKFHSSSGR